MMGGTLAQNLIHFSGSAIKTSTPCSRIYLKSAKAQRNLLAVGFKNIKEEKYIFTVITVCQVCLLQCKFVKSLQNSTPYSDSLVCNTAGTYILRENHEVREI